MSTELDPIVGNWYRHLDKGQTFTVIEVDERESIVEIQHYDGDIEEVSLSNWYEQDLELSAEPEDWSGPVDNVEEDDTGYSETQMSTGDWTGPLEDNRPEPGEAWEDPRPEDEREAPEELGS